MININELYDKSPNSGKFKGSFNLYKYKILSNIILQNCMYL